DVGRLLRATVELGELGLDDERVEELVLERLIEVEVRVRDLTVAARVLLAPRRLDPLQDLLRSRDAELDRERFDRHGRVVLDLLVMRSDRLLDRVRTHEPALHRLQVRRGERAIDLELEVTG